MVKIAIFGSLGNGVAKQNGCPAGVWWATCASPCRRKAIKMKPNRHFTLVVVIVVIAVWIPSQLLVQNVVIF